MASSGNICTWNFLTKNSYGTLSQGNLKILGSSNSGGQRALSSFGLTSGKWYMEFRAVNAGNNYPRIGLSLGSAFDNANFSGDGYQAAFLFEAGSENNGSNCKNANDSTGRGKFGTVSYTNTGVSGGSNIFGFALDLDNRKLFISKDGTYFNSGDPANGTNPQIAWTSTPSEFIHLWGDAYQTATQIIANWGQDSTFSGNETAGGNADGNGFGDFKYSPPTGFLAVCSANLPISDDIDPAQTDDDYPGKNFNTVLYTGNASNGHAITGVGFQPDMVWYQRRSVTGAYGNGIIDSSRGANKGVYPNRTNAEADFTNDFASFDSDGFTLNSGSSGNINNSGQTFVSWCWKANGGTTASNSDGDITSTVQANTKAGFSIVTYSGTLSGPGTASVGHGLTKKPDFLMSKARTTNTDNGNWHCSHVGLTNFNYRIRLNTDEAQANRTSAGDMASLFTSSTFGTNSTSGLNTNGDTYVAYVWHNVEGFQKFGGYTGNGNADGPFVYTGFRPRMLFLKRIDGAGSWQCHDSERDTYNPVEQILLWNTTDAEFTSGGARVDFYSNGFKLRNDNAAINASGGDFVFGAWGDVPFKYNNTF